MLTVAEGEIFELHIGLKGTMSSLFLKDLAQKTRRGLEGRVRNGKSAGGITYGYDVVRTFREDGTHTTGERQINPEQSEIVRQIFRDYGNGKSPRAIAARLNWDGVPGPRGPWGASTIYGNQKRGTGVLNNELYIGKLVWNRQRFVKNPLSGKRQARPNPPEDWVIGDVLDLRIIDDALWTTVKARQAATYSTAIREGISKARRPVHLFSGLLTCGACGGGVILVGKAYYGCSAARNKGTCNNQATMRRDRLEAVVLQGLKEQLLHPDLIEEFARTYQAEYNRLAAQTQNSRDTATAELSRVLRQIDRIVEAIAEGMFHPSMRTKLDELESRKTELEETLSAEGEEQPVLLHPALAERCRQQVDDLQAALGKPGAKAETIAIIRSLLEEIRLIPDGVRHESGTLVLELEGRSRR